MQAILASSKPSAAGVQRKANMKATNLRASASSRQQPSARQDEQKPALSSKLKMAGLAALAAAVVSGGATPNAAVASGQSGSVGAVITGKARVVDGDTLVINGTERIRLYGIDSPESKQICKLRGADWACGKAAAEALQRELDRVGGSMVKCTVVNGDMYGREVAKCQAANGEEINGWMVSNGWALAYRQYSKEFVANEDKARAAKAGVWQSEFQAPWDWRKDNRASLSTNRPAPAQSVSMPAPAPVAAPPPAKKEVAPAPTGCNIKGNIGSNGDKIYHIPGGKSYDKTVINEKQGEKYFCSEDEAIAAGWRPALD